MLIWSVNFNGIQTQVICNYYWSCVISGTLILGNGKNGTTGVFRTVLTTLKPVAFSVVGSWPIQGNGDQDPRFSTGPDCTDCALDIQAQIGGQIYRMQRPPGPNGEEYPLGRSDNNPDGDWFYHDVVVNDGRVYDSFTGPEGMTPGDFMAQWDAEGG